MSQAFPPSTSSNYPHRLSPILKSLGTCPVRTLGSMLTSGLSAKLSFRFSVELELVLTFGFSILRALDHQTPCCPRATRGRSAGNFFDHCLVIEGTETGGSSYCRRSTCFTSLSEPEDSSSLTSCLPPGRRGSRLVCRSPPIAPVRLRVGNRKS